jgi:hypothetical protein
MGLLVSKVMTCEEETPQGFGRRVSPNWTNTLITGTAPLSVEFGYPRRCKVVIGSANKSRDLTHDPFRFNRYFRINGYL